MMIVLDTCKSRSISLATIGKIGLNLHFLGINKRGITKEALGLRIHLKHDHFLATMANYTLMHTLHTQATTNNHP